MAKEEKAVEVVAPEVEVVEEVTETEEEPVPVEATETVEVPEAPKEEVKEVKPKKARKAKVVEEVKHEVELNVREYLGSSTSKVPVTSYCLLNGRVDCKTPFAGYSFSIEEWNSGKSLS